MRTLIFAALLLGLCAIAAASAAKPLDATVRARFAAFEQRYNKTYSDAEREFRLRVYHRNLARTEYMNSVAREAGDDDRVYGETQFMDLTPAEFKGMYLSNVVPKSRAYKQAHLLPEPTTSVQALPSSFDWRTKNPISVNPVRNQGQCGSCWAFSTVEEIASMVALSRGSKVPELSVQQIVDCDTQYDGCGGGDTTGAYQYVIKNGGLETESQYPYTAQNGQCHAKGPYSVNIKSWGYVSSDKNNTQIQAKMMETGPVSICVDASSWQFYIGGGHIIKHICGHSLDHCVQLTGWSTRDDTPYWIIRNSWGASWGNDGYVYVEIDSDDLCGVAVEPTQPVA